MTVLLKNNATSRLSANLSAGATFLLVLTDEGARFPNPGAGETFPLTAVKADGSYEIMRCTARVGDMLTVTRAMEGTTAIDFSVGDRVELRLTAGAIDEKFTAPIAANAAAIEAHDTTLGEHEVAIEQNATDITKRLEIYGADEIPTTDVGPIYVEGQGPMEWDPISAANVPKSGGATGGGPDKIFYKNGQTITTDYTIAADENAVTTGPITVEADVVVEGNWVIL